MRDFNGLETWKCERGGNNNSVLVNCGDEDERLGMHGMVFPFGNSGMGE